MRRKHDQYFTPATATQELLAHVRLDSRLVFECCCGADDITKVILNNSYAIVKTNDIDQSLSADYHLDMTLPESWDDLNWSSDWVISNPPFNQAPQIVPLAYNYACVGIAMLLRLSYLEPCFNGKSNRAAWLADHPPNKLVVLPRISFTGDGKTDNVTCAWMIWEKDPAAEKYIKVVPR